MQRDQEQFAEGSADPKPYKVDRVTKDGDFVERVAEYAREEEAMKHHRRLDWHYSIHIRCKKIWPPQP
jgi:hypothetical protein